MPFDQFVKWQLAGDELAPNDPLAQMATGFLGAGVFPTQLTEAEFVMFAAYYEVKGEREKEEMDKAKAKARR